MLSPRHTCLLCKFDGQEKTHSKSGHRRGSLDCWQRNRVAGLQIPYSDNWFLVIALKPWHCRCTLHNQPKCPKATMCLSCFGDQSLRKTSCWTTEPRYMYIDCCQSNWLGLRKLKRNLLFTGAMEQGIWLLFACHFPIECSSVFKRKHIHVVKRRCCYAVLYVVGV